MPPTKLTPPDTSKLDFAEPEEKLGYAPYRPSFQQPPEKNTSGAVVKRPYRDYGTARFERNDVYYSAEVLNLELERLWSKVWIMVGHLNDIPAEDRFIKFDIGRESILVVRGKGDEVRAFYNVCSHRGARLVTRDYGGTRKFTCPFHGWEFNGAGDVTHVRDRETFRREALCHDLNIPKVRTTVWRGWVFITLDDSAPTLEEFLGKDFMAAMDAYNFEQVFRIRDVMQEWPMNWKVAHEAFNEGYHVQATHPQLWPLVNAYHTQIDLFDNGHARSIYQFMAPDPHRVHLLKDEITDEHKLFLREAGVKEEHFPKHWRDVPDAIVRGKRAKKGGIDYSKFTESQLMDDFGMGFFPSHEWFLHPEGFLIQCWLPHASDPEKCVYHARVYAVPGMTELPTFMGVSEADLTGKTFIQRTYADPDDTSAPGPVVGQDREVLPRVQAGIHSKGFRGGILSEQEIRIRDFYHNYFQYLSGEK